MVIAALWIVLCLTFHLNSVHLNVAVYMGSISTACVLINASFRGFLCPSGCEPIPVQYVRWGDPEPIAAVVFACLGLLATLFVTSVFIK